ncbi:MAG: hypothetical protein ACI9U2_002111, partial [Bradymonadia bacterium]
MPNTSVAHLLVGAGLLICLSDALAAEPAPAEAPAVAPAVASASVPAVVRIFCNGIAGAGVVYGDRMQVLTAHSTVRSGRPVEVVFADGQSIDAHTVAIDSDSGLALLALASAAPVEPLTVHTAPLVVGAAVHGLFPAETSWRSERKRPPALVPGTVAAVGGAGLRVALGAPADAAGAPVLDPTGRLIGLVRAPGPIAEVVPAGRFSALTDDAKAEPD